MCVCLFFCFIVFSCFFFKTFMWFDVFDVAFFALCFFFYMIKLVVGTCTAAAV